MCEFCEGRNNLSKSEKHEMSLTSHNTIYASTTILGGCEFVESIKIKYCPMCRRELNRGTNENR